MFKYILPRYVIIIVFFLFSRDTFSKQKKEDKIKSEIQNWLFSLLKSDVMQLLMQFVLKVDFTLVPE